jgi:16S rRNA processing protein RimM
VPGHESQPKPKTSAPFYAVKDLAGCRVFTETGEELGELKDVLPSGGNDIFVVANAAREYLIPALKTVVRNIDIAAKRIDVVLPPGLREIYET